MIRRVLFFFPVLLFILIRQLYANLLGISKDILTAAVYVTLAMIAVWAFQSRMREVRRDFLLLDVLNLSQSGVASLAICAYFLAGKIEANQATYAFYYYCIAPFLIYSGFLIARMKPVTRTGVLVASGCAYLVTFWVAVFESLGVEFWLFQYDRWELQKNYLDVARASGLYGTHIDYGLLSFLVFTVAFYRRLSHRHWFTTLIMTVAAAGTLLSMSRAWVAAAAAVVFLHLIQAQSLKRKLQTALVVAVAGLALYSIADRLGFVTMLEAADVYTQESNESRLDYVQNAPKWLREYMILGTGPGTQNGPDAHGQKFIGDFLWLSTLVECGTILGGLLVLARVVVIGLVIQRSLQLTDDSGLRPIAIVACLSFLLASFIDAAYAHFISVSAFYVISALVLSRPPKLVSIEG
jgi:hypothetical protein